MSQEMIIALAIIVVFLILGLVALFRFPSVKQTFEGWGIKFGITGSGRKPGGGKAQADHQAERPPGAVGDSSVRIGGKAVSSRIRSEGERSGRVSVGEDVEKSRIRTRGKEKSSTVIGGDLEESDVDSRTG